MTLSKSSLGKIDTPKALEFDNVIIQETNIGNNAPLTTTTYIIPSPIRTPPRADANLSEILSYLNIRPN
jgi:hypothetical protein